jgi:ribulokinase
MAEIYVIGVDAGTESMRAGVFDLNGAVIAEGVTPITTRFPQPGWAEQSPEEWWQALGSSVRQAVSSAGIRPDQIVGLAADTTCCTVVALDAQGRSLRPAIIWMDMRAAAQAARIATLDDPALKVNNAGRGPISAEWMIPKSLWMAEHQPDLFERADYICDCQDYINFHLTGRMVANITSASTRWHYDSRTGYATSLLDKLNLQALLDRWPLEVLPLGEVIGGLTPAAATHLGLPAGIPVAQGGSDAFIGMIGMGVVQPNRLAMITGSSHNHLGFTDTEVHGAGFWGTYPDAVIPGLHAIEGGQTSTGSIINWFKKLIDPAITYDDLNAQASTLPPGSEGLVVLDHFQGNRTPYTDPNSRGAITGLTLRHGPAHIFRAMMEGVAFGTELILETMGAAGFIPEDVVVCGGSTKSDLWMQIHADVSGLPLKLTAIPNAPMLGSAILAAFGSGHYDSIQSAASQMVQIARTIEPDQSRHAAYAEPYQAYKALYPALAGIARP